MWCSQTWAGWHGEHHDGKMRRQLNVCSLHGCHCYGRTASTGATLISTAQVIPIQSWFYILLMNDSNGIAAQKRCLMLQDHLRASQGSSIVFRILTMIRSIPNHPKPVGSIRFVSLSLRAHMRKRSAPGICADKGGKAPKGQNAWGETIYSTCKRLIFHNWGIENHAWYQLTSFEVPTSWVTHQHQLL